MFGVGDDIVIKLPPALMKAHIQQELDFYESLDKHPGIPAPRLVAKGEIEDWLYLVMTRIAGIPLNEAWSQVPTNQQCALAGSCGKSLADLHALPTVKNPGNIDWEAFCQKGIINWPGRPSVLRLPPDLRKDGPRYLQTHAGAVAKAPRVMLHGDLAPENLMVRQSEGRWEIVAMIDFGNAMRGDAWFDLTAPTILLEPGNRDVVHAMIDGGIPGGSSRLAEVRPALMVNTLVHPLGDISACLDLIPGATACRTWDEVALLFWPA